MKSLKETQIARETKVDVPELWRHPVVCQYAVKKYHQSPNFVNGEANIEIAPGMFATNAAWMLLRDLGIVVFPD